MKTWRWRREFLKSDLSSTTKLVLLVLAAHMDDMCGECFPSQTHLARQTGLSKRAVIEHLGRAEQAGWLRKKSRGLNGSKWSSIEYDATQPDEVNVLHLWGERGSPQRCRTFTPGVNDVHACGVNDVHPTYPYKENITSPVTISCDQHTRARAEGESRSEILFEELKTRYPSHRIGRWKRAKEIWEREKLAARHAEISASLEAWLASGLWARDPATGVDPTPGFSTFLDGGWHALPPVNKTKAEFGF